MSGLSEYACKITVLYGAKLTENQNDAIRFILWASNTDHLQEWCYTSTGIACKQGRYFIEIDKGSRTGKLTGNGMKDKYFTYTVEEETPEKSDGGSVANNNVTYLDMDGRFRGVYKPIMVTEGYPGKKVPKGKLTIYDAESRKKLFSCLCPRDSAVVDSIFEDYCGSRSESASMLDEEREPDAPESNVELDSNAMRQSTEPESKPVPTQHSAVNLFGDTIPTPAIQARQLNLFDKTDYIRLHRGIPAVICRENGEKASGAISTITENGRFSFEEQETGKTYSIPARCCTVTWAGDIAIIEITETELSRRVSLYGMFASCCLF